MQGMGDCLHQRAVIRELQKSHDVWLETSWPAIYWDMPEVRLLPSGTTLRTQRKNIERERGQFTSERPPRDAARIMVHTPPREILRVGSVLGAMSSLVGVPVGDFRLPVRDEWLAKADAVLERLNPQKPVMFFRPLTVRTEWTGGQTRNPDPKAYRELYESVRDQFYVVSIADLMPGKEWLVGSELSADVAFHAGELDVETLFGLAKRSALMFGAPGFITVMGQAVGTPTVTVFGGYEDARSFSPGARFSPWLPIEPIRPCPCWSHTHECRKEIDVPAAKVKLLAFMEEVAACA